jgi:hypothetical protein
MVRISSRVRGFDRIPGETAGTFPRRPMGTNKVVYNLMNIQGALTPLLCLTIGVCFSPESAVPPSIRSVLSLKVICMNFRLYQV